MDRRFIIHCSRLPGKWKEKSIHPTSGQTLRSRCAFILVFSTQIFLHQNGVYYNGFCFVRFRLSYAVLLLLLLVKVAHSLTSPFGICCSVVNVSKYCVCVRTFRMCVLLLLRFQQTVQYFRNIPLNLAHVVRRYHRARMVRICGWGFYFYFLPPTEEKTGGEKGYTSAQSDCGRGGNFAAPLSSSTFSFALRGWCVCVGWLSFRSVALGWFVTVAVISRSVGFLFFLFITKSYRISPPLPIRAYILIHLPGSVARCGAVLFVSISELLVQCNHCVAPLSGWQNSGTVHGWFEKRGDKRKVKEKKYCSEFSNKQKKETDSTHRAGGRTRSAAKGETSFCTVSNMNATYSNMVSN